ncbi:hypothetical protein BJ508DRAFT_113704 [Ascobolus immersus RN42]|uniref:Uncharacterized protein n=1 Tax=Ascobolus immersus RN42 TaxID=1160509 RepID=A0A3N4I5I9_ASCIM|nr:hypothetical protein BJ508DRAFT_113704 [Ascobolus immersus RN42]
MALLSSLFLILSPFYEVLLKEVKLFLFAGGSVFFLFFLSVGYFHYCLRSIQRALSQVINAPFKCFCGIA